MLDEALRQIKKFIPKRLFNTLAPIYHYKLAFIGACLYRFPSRKLTVIAVTGTKGKSSTTELINSIFEATGRKTALLNTIRFKIGDESTPNKRKMTVPGRLFLHKMLRKAISAGCDTAIVELSSEAAKQYRHKFIYLDALVFLNLAPEHIEAHGSYEAYRAAKLSFVQNLKKDGRLIVNSEDPESKHFIEATDREHFSFALADAKPYELKPDGIDLTFKGQKISSLLIGEFNLKNILAAAVTAESFHLPLEKIKAGIERVANIPGRVEFVKAGQDFDVVVDYAHTSESLTELYRAFDGKRRVCVLGNTGGGRDKWKRPEMAKVADSFCDTVFLTDEDPYDEDPGKIIDEMLPGFVKVKPKVIMDRREAIRAALRQAQGSNQPTVVLITGKGTDPFIMGRDGKKTPWSDSKVAKEELEKLVRD